MTDPKDTATAQTMRAHLRQHGLPEAWAEWVREIHTAYNRERMVSHVELRGPGMWCKFDLKDGEPPWWMRDKPPGFVAECAFGEKKPKLSADDITAALWDMPGKERTVVLYQFWPAISEAAQRTHHAEEKATAAIADAAHYRCLLNDCRRVLTTAEDDRDAARKERDEARLDAGRLRNELSRARQQVGARENESIAEALQSIVVALEHERNGALTQRDDALRKLAEATPLPTGTGGMVQGADGWEYPKPSPFTERAEKLRELCLEMASYLTERAGRGK